MVRNVMCCILAGAMLVTVPMAVAGESSVEMGKKLFNDPSLGGSTNEKSCGSCHPGGEGLENSGNKENLVQMINRCIQGPLKGEKIDGGTVEMDSLKIYIQSLGK